MPDGVFNIAKGSMVEKIRDAATNVGVLLLQAAEADNIIIDHDELTSLFGGANTEATFTNYARKTGLTGVITIDDTNDWVDTDIPDQTFTAAGGATNNTLVKLVTFYEDAAAEGSRVPMTHHDFGTTTDGSDLTAQIAATGISRAS